MKLKLEDKLIRALGPGDYYDTVVPRLVLRVRETARRYAIRYRTGTVTRRFTLGDARVLTLAQARKRAKVELGKVDGGADPQEAKAVARRERDSATVEALALAFLADQQKRWRPRTAYEFERLIRREVIPELGSRHPRDVTRKDVRRWHKELAEARPATANRVLEILRLIYAWAIDEDKLEASPIVSIKRAAEGTGERTFSDRELLAILAAAPGTTYRGIVPLIMWTGVRSHEARSARWQDFDFRRELWTIPAEYRKGRHNGPARKVPLSAPAVAVLDALGRRDLGWAFPALTRPCDTCGEPGHAAKGTWAVGKMREASGVADFRVHDIRRTVGQRVSDEFGTERMHLVLGHTRDDLAQRYAPAPALKLAREALAWWGEELAKVEAAR